MHAPPLPPATISAAALPLIADVLGDAGLDVPQALTDCGLTPDLPPAAVLPLRQFTGLLQAAGDQVRDDARLWLCGRMISRPALATLFPSGLGERRLDGLLDRLLADLEALQDGTTFERIVAEDTCILSYRIHDPSIWPRSRDAEFTLGFLHAVLSRFAGPEDAQILDLAFEHERDCGGNLARWSGLAPRYGQPANMLAFPARLLQLPVHAGDIAAAASGPAVPREPAPCSAHRRISSAICRRVGQGPFTQADIAADLGISDRSLRRLLDPQGLTFRTVLEQARLAYAVWALRQTALPVGEIAWRLGYDDQGAFARAFRRASGTSPSRFRQDRRGR